MAANDQTEARFWVPEGQGARCLLCPHACRLDRGQTGLCNVRQYDGDALVSLVYGYPVSGVADPIEKKPLYHFYPGTNAYSYATVGCNLACTFCQNYSLSQVDKVLPRARFVAPEELVEHAVSAGCKTIAHTYSEPTIFAEYALDVARAGRARGLDSVFVTNGFVHGEARREIGATIQAANVDLKSFSDQTYRTVCRGRLQPVLETIAEWHSAGVWVEVTTLVIPGLNDSPQELGDMAGFLADIDPGIPWHVSRFHPDYHMTDRGVTPVSTLKAAVAAGTRAGLHHVYVGNLAGEGGEHTQCGQCQRRLISRHRFVVLDNQVRNGCCPSCEAPLPGRFLPS
jgi:pyruvate formate lyase activating enzyme